MKLPPYVEQRGTVYWFRRRVPPNLIPIVGRAEFRESLKTSDPGAARTLSAYRNAAVELEFEKARHSLKRMEGVRLVVPPTPEEERYIRDAVRFHVLDQDEFVRLGRPDDDTQEAYEDLRADELEAVIEGLRTGRIAWGDVEKSRMGKLLASVGVHVEPGSPAWEPAAYRATEGLNEALRVVVKRSAGVHQSTPDRPELPTSLTLVPLETPSEPVAALTRVTLGHVIDDYLKGLPENDFRRKVRRCLQLFGEILGRGTEVSDLRQKNVTAFMRDICRLPVKWTARFDAGETVEELLASEPEKVMSPTTYETNYRGPLGTFLTSAARDFGDDGFRLFTVEGIAYTGDRVAEEDQQRALTPAELVTLFEGEHFRELSASPRNEPLYWLLVVMLFTGGRPREVCQVNPQVDFGQIDDGWYIDFTMKSAAGAGVTKKIKNGEARRIPLHAELVRLGFPQYLQRLKDAKADRLFPSWRIKGGNPYTAHYKLVADLLRASGLYTRSAPPGELVTGAYTLRKTFITECRNQGVVSKEITGHSDGTTTAIQDRHYIFGAEPLARKREQLAKLVVPVTVPVPRHGPI